jgi:Protein of unknown function (DUF3828)
MYLFRIILIKIVPALALISGCSNPAIAIDLNAEYQSRTNIPSRSLRFELASTQAEAQIFSNPRSVVEQFYRAYISQKIPWRDRLRAYIDPGTYQKIKSVNFSINPFTGTQVQTFDYRLGQLKIMANKAEVEVLLKSDLRKPPQSFNHRVTVILQRNQMRWQIQNVIYSSKLDDAGQPDDLLHEEGYPVR